MFTSAFANQVIVPATQTQPLIISSPTHFALHILLRHPAFFDACFVLVQLTLGILILRKRSTKLGLKASVAWGLIVWYFGEGLAGLLSGHASLLMGAPGAALLYAVLALAVMPSGKDNRPAYWLPLAWAIFWIGGAIYQLLPDQNSTSVLSSMISGMTNGAPGWLASLQIHAANFLNGKSFSTIVVLAASQALIGILILLPGYSRKIAIGAGIILSLIFWFVGQGLGTYYSGLATDPNSAPLFILLGVAILGCRYLPFNQLRRSATHDFEQLII